MRQKFALAAGIIIATLTALWLVFSPPGPRAGQGALFIVFALAAVLVASLLAHKVAPGKRRWVWSTGVAVVALVALATVLASLPDPPPPPPPPTPTPTATASEPTPSTTTSSTPTASNSPSSTPTLSDSPTGVPTPSDSTPPPPVRVKMYVIDLEPQDDFGWDEGELEIDGDLYVRTVYAKTSGCVRNTTVDYPLSRDWGEVGFTAGLGDESEEGAKALLVVYADSTPIFEQTMKKGEHRSVERSLKVGGRMALNLRFEVTMLPDSSGHCARPGRTAFGDPVLTS